MVRVSLSAKLRPWSELTAKMVMGVVPGLVSYTIAIVYRLMVFGTAHDWTKKSLDGTR